MLYNNVSYSFLYGGNRIVKDSLMVEMAIIKSLLFHEDYARKVMPYLEKRFFMSESSVLLFDVYKKYFDSYNKIPSLEVLAIEINNLKSIKDDVVAEIGEVLDYVIENKDEIVDIDWLFHKTEEHAKSVLLDKAITKTIQISDKATKNVEQEILALYEEISELNFDNSVGLALFDDVEKRYESYMQPEDILPFRLKILNSLFGGGGRRKTLACLVGKTNIGKSLHLCHHAADFVRNGYNVVYFSGEMSEKMTYERIDSNLTGISIEDFRDQKIDKKQYLDAIAKIKKTNGNLIVKEFPTASAHVGHMKKVLRELRQKRKFVADIVIIDYLNLFISQKANKSDNMYSSIKSVAEEIRGMCVEENVFCLTATQLNRGGSKNQDSADETDVSDSYGISMTADIMIGIFDTEEMIEQNIQGLNLWKTRFSKKSDVKTGYVNVDWEHMKLNEQSEVVNAINGRSDEVKEIVKQSNNVKSDVEWS